RHTPSTTGGMPSCASGAGREPRDQQPSQTEDAWVRPRVPSIPWMIRERASMRLAARRPLEGLGNAEDPLLGEMRSQDLPTDGEAVDATDRQGKRGNAGEVRGHREHIAQVHLVGV